MTPNDFNRTIYHSTSKDTDSRIKELHDDAEKLIERCGGGFAEIAEFQLLVRCLPEQTTVEGGKRMLRTKEYIGMSSDILQSPADPEAISAKRPGNSIAATSGTPKNPSVKTDLSSQGTAMIRTIPVTAPCSGTTLKK